MAKSNKRDRDKEKRRLERPMFLQELVEAVRQRDALKPFDPLPLQFSMFAAAETEPEIDCRVEALERGEGQDSVAFRVDVAIKGLRLGQHAYPPRAELREFKPEHDILERQREQPDFDGYLPDHVALRPLPRHLPPDLEVARRTEEYELPDRSKDIHMATTIFSPDDRYLFNDTSFPWCTTGRVDSPGGQASGVMVGPRHMLTCSHVIQWKSDGTAGWVKFTPSYFDGSAPFGVAWGTWIYWEGLKVFGPTINASEGRHDYVCVVLNWNIGNVTGWMGSRTYSDSWDGGKYWSHIGYPGDLAGGQRPSYQGSIALDGSFWDPQAHQRIYHKGDVWPGQSGGPFFGWWSGEGWPRVVADQSGQNPSENSASGGAHMVDCIIRARNDFP
jgi:V8-like Glu-specific endopeptidase